MEEGGVKWQRGDAVWKLRKVYADEWRWDSLHKSLAAAKAEAGHCRNGLPAEVFEIYSPDGALHLVSGPGNGWRLRWRKANA